MIMTKKSVWIGMAILFIAMSGCTSNDDSGDGQDVGPTAAYSDAQIRLAELETGTLQRRVLSSVVSCTGEIEVPPQGMASVTAPLGGYLKETVMVPGAYVRKGQLLATLTSPEYISLQQSYLETSGELTFAGRDFARQKMLQEQNATAEKKMQESESTFAVLKARLSGLKAQLNLIGIDVQSLDKGNIQSVVNLRAPMTGYVTAVNHHPGAFVEPREAIFEIVNLNELHLHLNVFEQDISAIRHGQKIRFRPTGDGTVRYYGEVSLVSPKRNEEARSFDVHGHIEAGDERLKPGMFIEAEILVSPDSVAALPEEAVLYNENKPFVLSESNGVYNIHPVEAGVKMDGWIEIKNGHTLENKRIVTSGASRVFAAMKKG